ncbi:MAG: phosphoglycerate kinase [Candidatus Pacearchaeota archaeon]
MKTLSDFNFKNKTVILRSDLNSDVIKGKIIPSERIKESAETIKELKNKGAKVIVIAHQGSPGKEDFISLKQHSKILKKYTKIKFVKDIIGKKAISKIKNLKPGKAILLENIRFEKEEFKTDKKNYLIGKLSSLADFYVNDAFSVCHREQASIVLFPKYLESCAGRLLEKEVNALKKLKIKNCLYILAGAKPSDNLKLMKEKKILACGLFGQMCLIAKGKKLGAQEVYLRNIIKDFGKIIGILKNKQKNVMTPIDFAVKFKGKRKEIGLEDFPVNFEIFDIGEKTINIFVKEIKKAKAIYMKGPAGDCSNKNFRKGTFKILKAISESKGFSVIGGGHLSDAIEKSKIDKNKFNHVSLSGGALLNYIAGEKLPGLEALK